MLAALGIGKPDATPTKPEPIDTESQDEEWEYYDGITE